MSEGNPRQAREEIGSIGMGKNVENILRTLTMLEKALDRLVRHHYHSRNQYPPLILEIEQGLNTLRSWIQDYKTYANLPVFSLQLSVAIKSLGGFIAQLVKECKPSAGKRGIKKSIRFRSNCLFVDRLIVCWTKWPAL
jgi:hypothetical protein